MKNFVLLVCCLQFFFQMKWKKICENRQPLVIFILNLHFYSITYYLTNQDRNYVDLLICHNLPKIGRIVTKTLPVLLPWLRVLIPCLAVLLPGLVDLLSKYWKILDWCFLYSVYVCLVLLKYLGIQQWNDFPVGVSDYARKTNYDWLYIICEKNYSKACVLSFLQSPSGVLFIICLQVLTFSFARVADLLTWLAVLLPGLVDLVSKYWKIWGWRFLYSIYVY